MRKRRRTGEFCCALLYFRPPASPLSRSSLSCAPGRRHSAACHPGLAAQRVVCVLPAGQVAMCSPWKTKCSGRYGLIGLTDARPAISRRA